MNTITETNYVDVAERHIRKLADQTYPRTGKQVPMVTTSKIRNLLAITSDIYNEVVYLREEKLPVDICSRISYLRVRFLYDAGRDPKVKELVVETQILDVLQEIQGSKKNFILFSRYMEALVAFRKYYGGKDE